MANKEKRLKHKAKIIELLGGKCRMCKRDDLPAYCYDINHLHPDKKYRDGAALLDLSWDRILLELSCCELLCACCHRIYHREETYGKQIV